MIFAPTESATLSTFFHKKAEFIRKKIPLEEYLANVGCFTVLCQLEIV